MTPYHLTILSPDNTVFDGEVIALSLRGFNGDLAVFAGHIPFVTSIKPGKCTVTLPDETEVTDDINTGLLDVGKSCVKLLIDSDDAFKGKF